MPKFYGGTRARFEIEKTHAKGEPKKSKADNKGYEG